MPIPSSKLVSPHQEASKCWCPWCTTLVHMEIHFAAATNTLAFGPELCRSCCCGCTANQPGRKAIKCFTSGTPAKGRWTNTAAKVILHDFMHTLFNLSIFLIAIQCCLNIVSIPVTIEQEEYDYLQSSLAVWPCTGRPHCIPQLAHRRRQVSVAYANFNPEVGYCQGMNFVIAVLLLVSGGLSVSSRNVSRTADPTGILKCQIAHEQISWFHLSSWNWWRSLRRCLVAKVIYEIPTQSFKTSPKCQEQPLKILRS